MSAENAFDTLPVSSKLNPLSCKAPQGRTLSARRRGIHDDDIQTTHIAVAIEDFSWSSPDYSPMLVIQPIFDNWDRALALHRSCPHISDIIAKHNLANSYVSFLTSSIRTGPCGIYLVSENFADLDNLIHFMLRKWIWTSI